MVAPQGRVPVAVVRRSNKMISQGIKFISALLSTLFLFGASLVAGEAPNYSSYARLLKTYVIEDKVDYAAWAENDENIAALDEFLEHLSQIETDSLSRNDQMAYYINLYNAAMLHVVLEKYPIDSVKNIGILPFSVFKQDFVQLLDRKVSLDEIEKGILLKDYFDSRIHFAVNCASEGCPPLRAEPFVGDRLETQLDEQTKLFAQSERAAKIDEDQKSVAYSELFKWYAKDFDVKNPAEYLNRYREMPLPTNYSVDWITYDWSLNQVSED